MTRCRALFGLLASLAVAPIACGSGQGPGAAASGVEQSSSAASGGSAAASSSGNNVGGASSSAMASGGSGSGGPSSGSAASGGGGSSSSPAVGGEAAGDAGSSSAPGSVDDGGQTRADASSGLDSATGGPLPGDGAPPRGDGATSGPLSKVTLFLAGDSTVSPYGVASAQQGWGEHLVDYLDRAVTVDDEAIAGRSVKTFMYDDAAETQIAAHWQAIQSRLVPGDYVMIEFGINDSSAGSPRFVAIADFTRLIGIMVDTILNKRATPILVTPSALQYWVNGVETNAREQPYADAMKQVASQKRILVDDLNAVSVAYLNKVGQNAAAQIYINGDKAHFTLMGALEMAKLVTQELVTIGSPLGAYVQ